MAVQTVVGLRAAYWVVLTLVLAAAGEVAAAGAEGGVARPSVEELAGRPSEKKGQKTPATARNNDPREAICLMIESAAKANDLPLEFFARVIWQESRFQTDAVGPVTRSGGGAPGSARV